MLVSPIWFFKAIRRYEKARTDPKEKAFVVANEVLDIPIVGRERDVNIYYVNVGPSPATLVIYGRLVEIVQVGRAGLALEEAKGMEAAAWSEFVKARNSGTAEKRGPMQSMPYRNDFSTIYGDLYTAQSEVERVTNRVVIFSVGQFKWKYEDDPRWYSLDYCGAMLDDHQPKLIFNCQGHNGRSEEDGFSPKL